MPERKEGEGRAAAAATEERRLEADLVRFEVKKLPSGLFRHLPAKFIFEIARKLREGRWSRG